MINREFLRAPRSAYRAAASARSRTACGKRQCRNCARKGLGIGRSGKRFMAKHHGANCTRASARFRGGGARLRRADPGWPLFRIDRCPDFRPGVTFQLKRLARRRCTRPRVQIRHTPPLRTCRIRAQQTEAVGADLLNSRDATACRHRSQTGASGRGRAGYARRRDVR